MRIQTYEIVHNLIDPTPIKVDLPKLTKVIDNIRSCVGYDPSSCLENPGNQSTITLTYPKNIPKEFVDRHGELRSKFIGGITGGETTMKEKYNISTADYTEMHNIVRYSYVNTIAKQLEDYHRAKYGSGKIAWIHSPTLGPGAGFSMHIDSHCTARYHIVLTTTKYSYMMVEEDNEIKCVHIPADGRVWFLNTGVLHNAVNFIPSYNEVSTRTHLIFSVHN